MTNWDEIVSDHGPTVLRLASRILGPGADAEDVVQDVFLEVYRLRQSRAVNNWGGLLRRVATHRALDRLRRRKATVSLDEVELSRATDNPQDAAIARELADRLREAIGKLPGQQAAVFCLRYFDDLSYSQIAEGLGVEAGAVGTSLNKARCKLKSLLNVSAERDRR